MARFRRQHHKKKRAVAVTVTMLLLKRLKQRNGRKKRVWCRKYILNHHEGAHEALIPKLVKDLSLFRNYHRIDLEQFNFLQEKISLLIQKNDTNFRMAISPAERLSITLRFLGTGEIKISL